jgi:hypothetical protein
MILDMSASIWYNENQQWKILLFPANIFSCSLGLIANVVASPPPKFWRGDRHSYLYAGLTKITSSSYCIK